MIKGHELCTDDAHSLHFPLNTRAKPRITTSKLTKEMTFIMFYKCRNRYLFKMYSIFYNELHIIKNENRRQVWNVYGDIRTNLEKLQKGSTRTSPKMFGRNNRIRYAFAIQGSGPLWSIKEKLHPLQYIMYVGSYNTVAFVCDMLTTF